jgi:hypothetical protein
MSQLPQTETDHHSSNIHSKYYIKSLKQNMLNKCFRLVLNKLHNFVQSYDLKMQAA